MRCLKSKKIWFESYGEDDYTTIQCQKEEKHEGLHEWKAKWKTKKGDE